MKKWMILIILLGVVFGGGFWFWKRQNLNPLGEKGTVKESNLERYDFDHLKQRGGVASEIKVEGNPDAVDLRRKNIDKNYKKKMTWESKIISFESNGKKITGMMNYFNDKGKHPVIIMIRGYADTVGYYSGFGTWKAADDLAKNGYVTISLDFLGYAGSDKESSDPLEARFEKVESVMDLIASVKKMDYVDPEKMGIWAHSNGGQIALSVLEVSGENLPTTLWAPMTQSFPQSVLDTNDTSPDNVVVKEIKTFEKTYDSRRYAFENYYEWIKAPIQIHQGTKDEWCEVSWQENLQNRLKNLGESVKLYIYDGDDHNLSKNWQLVMSRDLTYFDSFLK